MSNIIMIHCWSKPMRNNSFNPKNCSKSWWEKLCQLLHQNSYIVWQCLQGPEIMIKNCDRHYKDKDFWELSDMIINQCFTWISIDSFMPHLMWYKKKKGIAIWGPSDPEIFGHPENINLLKDKKYLRANQFQTWEESPPFNADAFVTPETVMNEVLRLGKEI